MNPDITILIPFLNEAENIERLTTELKSFIADKKGISFEVIFIDDGSTDQSVELLKKTAYPGYRSRIIKLSKNYGSHAALRAGILQAEGRYVTFMYADLQDPLDLITRLYEKIISGKNNIVWGFRNTVKENFTRKLFSRSYAWLMRKFALPNFPDQVFDIVMFDGKVKQELNRNIETNSSLFLQILNLGFRQDSIRYDKLARQAGKSKWTLRKKIKLFIDSFVAYSYFPIRMVSIIGLLMAIVGFGWAVYIVSRKLFFHDLVQGWPTLISVLLIGFGVTNISLGIIAEYLWRTLDASRKRSVFIVDEMIELHHRE